MEHIYIVEDGEADGIEISARSPQEAAEKYAAEGDWRWGGDLEIYVTPIGEEDERDSYTVYIDVDAKDPMDEMMEEMFPDPHVHY